MWSGSFRGGMGAVGHAGEGGWWCGSCSGGVGSCRGRVGWVMQGWGGTGWVMQGSGVVGHDMVGGFFFIQGGGALKW